MGQSLVIAFAVLVLSGLAYLGARFAIQASDDLAYRGPVGAGSLDGAVQMGTLAGLYRGACEGTPYAERLFVRRLGPLLQRRVVYTDRFAVRVGVEGWTASDTLAFDDGTEAPCCFEVRRAVPETIWLVRDGERVCRFDLDPDSRSDGLPNGARATEP